MEVVIIFIILGVVVFWFFRRIFNLGGCLGAIIGIFLGSGLGVAGGGGASNGWFIFGVIGFVIGGTIASSKSNKN